MQESVTAVNPILEQEPYPGTHRDLCHIWPGPCRSIPHPYLAEYQILKENIKADCCFQCMC